MTLVDLTMYVKRKSMSDCERLTTAISRPILPFGNLPLTMLSVC